MATKKVTIEMLGAFKLIYSELDEETADELMTKVSQMLATRHLPSWRTLLVLLP
jgi:hypothetical protein